MGLGLRPFLLEQLFPASLLRYAPNQDGSEAPLGEALPLCFVLGSARPGLCLTSDWIPRAGIRLCHQAGHKGRIEPPHLLPSALLTQPGSELPFTPMWSLLAVTSGSIPSCLHKNPEPPPCTVPCPLMHPPGCSLVSHLWVFSPHAPHIGQVRWSPLPSWPAEHTYLYFKGLGCVKTVQRELLLSLSATVQTLSQKHQ